MFSFIGHFWRSLTRKEKLDSELSDEVRTYLQLLIDEKVAAGMDPAEARRQARLAIGSEEQVHESVRDQRPSRWLDGLVQDTHYALRSLRREGGTSLLAVIMLALGIGATATTASVFHAVLIQSVPFTEPERLLELWETRLDRGWKQNAVTEANWWDIRDRASVFSSMGAITGTEVNMTGQGDPEHLSAGRASADLFRTLGVRPIAGRDFEPNEDHAGDHDLVAILSEKYWQKRFSRSTEILGRAITLDGKSYRIVGVMPRGDPLLNSSDIFIPMVFDPKAYRGSFELSVYGRLKPGVSLNQASQDLARVARSLEEQYPREDHNMGVYTETLANWGKTPELRQAMWILMGAVGCLLLIACVNLANLLLARGAARMREMTIRTALGASQGRIIRLAILESGLIGLGGSFVGLLLAAWGLSLLRNSALERIPRWEQMSLNGWVLGITLCAVAITSIAAAIAPALRMCRVHLNTGLRDGDRAQTAGQTQHRFSTILVSVEVALSLVLLLGAGLMIRSLQQVLTVDRGFASEGRIMATVTMPGSYSGERIESTVDALVTRIQSTPGVQAAGVASSRPVMGWDTGMGIVSTERPDPAGGVPWASWRRVTNGYFRAMGIPILAGRAFRVSDAESKVRPVLISKTLADLFWPGQNPIGRGVLLWRGQGNDPAEVIGIVGNIRDHGLDTDPTRMVYLPYYGSGWGVAHFFVQTKGPSAAVVPEIRAALRQIDSSLPLSDVQTMDEMLNESVGPRRMSVWLLAVFAVIALTLSVIGIYGVLAYTVAQRTPEIGLRMALGATTGGILSMVLLQGLRPVLIGIAGGMLGGIALSRVLKALLFQTKPTDPTTYAVVITVIVCTGLAACWLPARRAIRVEPNQALRNE